VTGAVAHLRASDPHFADECVSRAASSAKRANGNRKQARYARAVGVSPSRASRHLSGTDSHAPGAEYLAQLALGGLNSWAVLVEGQVVVHQALIRTASTEKLEARLAELDDAEHDAQAREDQMTLRAVRNPSAQQLDEAAEADVVEATIAVERAAIRRELAERKRRRTY